MPSQYVDTQHAGRPPQQFFFLPHPAHLPLHPHTASVPQYYISAPTSHSLPTFAPRSHPLHGSLADSRSPTVDHVASATTAPALSSFPSAAMPCPAYATSPPLRSGSASVEPGSLTSSEICWPDASTQFDVAPCEFPLRRTASEGSFAHSVKAAAAVARGRKARPTVGSKLLLDRSVKEISPPDPHRARTTSAIRRARKESASPYTMIASAPVTPLSSRPTSPVTDDGNTSDAGFSSGRRHCFSPARTTDILANAARAVAATRRKRGTDTARGGPGLLLAAPVAPSEGEVDGTATATAVFAHLTATCATGCQLVGPRLATTSEFPAILQPECQAAAQV